MNLEKAVLGMFIIWISVLAGCTPFSPILSSTVSPEVLPTNTTSFIEVPTSTMSPMGLPTRVRIQTETPTIHISNTPTARVENTQLPTLSSIESEKYGLKLLENNGGCSLPCVWDIVPGKTSYRDAKHFFEFLGWKGSISNSVYETEIDLKETFLTIRTTIYADDSNVKKMTIGIGADDYLNAVKYFSFANVLNTLGKPTQILVSIGVTPGFLEPSETSYEILLYYETQNILIEYVGTAEKIGNSYQACLSQPNARSSEENPRSGNVSLYIGEAKKIETPDELVRPFWILPSYYISSEKAFGMGVDKFYETAKQNPETACFTSPLSTWNRRIPRRAPLLRYRPYCMIYLNRLQSVNAVDGRRG